MHAAREVDAPIRSKKWNACALFLTFTCTLFNLIALGIPWFYHSGGCDATLLYCVSKTTSFEKKAGDPAIVFLLIGFVFHLFALFSLYFRWGGRRSWLPHSPVACCVYFTLSCLSFLIAVAVYAGTMNKHKKSIPGSFGPGFGLACFILAVDGLSAIGVILGGKEIGAAGVPQLRSESDIQQLARTKTSQVRVVGRLGMQRAADNWQKAPINSTILFMATVNLLFVIISLGLAWWHERVTGANVGLVQKFERLPKTGPLNDFRRAGDPTFAFTVAGFFVQFYVLIAVTIRYLGRDDVITAKIPHSLRTCVIANAISCAMCLIAVAIYAGVFHDHRHDDGIYGNIGGGFGLMILNCILAFCIIVVLVWKKGEIADQALHHHQPDSLSVEGNPHSMESIAVTAH